MDYKILISKNVDDLERDVKAKISCGWIPFGGIAMDGENIAQAMIKEK